MKQLRVLAVIDDLITGGGAERLLASLLPALASRGVICDLAVLRECDALAGELELSGIKVIRLGLSNLWTFPRSILGLHAVCRRERYDILWGHLFFGNLNAMLVGALNSDSKVVVFLESPGYRVSPPKSVGRRVSMMIERWAGLHLADRIVAVSQAMAEDYREALGWPAIEVINNCVPVGALPPPIEPGRRGVARKRVGVPEDAFLIVLPARLVPIKGHGVLLESMATLRSEKDWHPYCVALGEGPERAALEAKARALGLQEIVRFEGVVPQSQVFELMQSADAVVLPSLHEPFGIAAAEAMALGVPTVITDAYGFKDLAGRDGAALLVKPGDSRSLAEALWRLRSEPKLRAELSEKGQARVRSLFDTPIIAAAWMKLFEAAVRSEK